MPEFIVRRGVEYVHWTDFPVTADDEEAAQEQVDDDPDWGAAVGEEYEQTENCLAWEILPRKGYVETPIEPPVWQLQDEVKALKKEKRALRTELRWAVNAFSSTCQCGDCGPCARLPRMEKLVR